jgi:hypothetical protein
MVTTITKKAKSWMDIYCLIPWVEHNPAHQVDTLSASSSHTDDTIPPLTFNFRFGSLLRRLEKDAIMIQHELACLSTLGGAYHLCNKPLVALTIAKQQEVVGRRLGSTNLIVRAKVFQAVNLRILGLKVESDKLFNDCHQTLEANPWLEELRQFVHASQLWLDNNFIGTTNAIHEVNNQRSVTYDENISEP